MKYLAPIPKQFVDQNGLPLSNGAVHVYISGDTQYANVYQDADGNELMPNPARLDSNGAWQGFVTAGIPLDYVVEDKDGNVQFSYQKVVAGGGTANVAIEPVLTSGTKIAECWVDGELLELFAPDGGAVTSAELPLRISEGKVTNNGTGLTCTGNNAWAEGDNTTASGHHSHSEGSGTIASGENSHAEGGATEATGGFSHSEGFKTKASHYGHAEGAGTEASSTASHAEGQDTVASGQASHAEGRGSEASGNYSHASGRGTRATNEGSHAVGRWNDDGDALFVVGDGTNDNQRHDAFKVDRNGDTWVSINGVITKVSDEFKTKIFKCVEPDWPNPIEMFDSYNNGKDLVIVRQSYSGVYYSVWRIENVVEDLGLVKNYTLEFQNEECDTTASRKTKRVKFHSTDYENWTITENTFYYPERKTIAPNWNSLDVSDYKEGTIVYRGGVLYACKTNTPSSSWVDSEWEETSVAGEIECIDFSYVDVTSDFDISYADAGLTINELKILYSKKLRLIYISFRAIFSTPKQIPQATPNITIARNTNPSSLLKDKEFSRVAYGKHTESNNEIELSGDTVRIYNNYLTFTPTKSYANPDRAIVYSLYARVLGFEIE